jgi:hypothetical protein
MRWKDRWSAIERASRTEIFRHLFGRTFSLRIAIIRRRAVWPPRWRQKYTKEISRLLDFIDKLLPKADRAVAQAIFASLVGTIQLTRSVSDPALSDQILAAGEAGALALVQAQRSLP